MRIIPAIDIMQGKCVRLKQGDYGRKKIYNGDLLQVAKVFENAGLRYLHLVDLDGARTGHVANWKVLERLARQTSLQIDFSGGIRDERSLSMAMECGANQVICGSIAVQERAVFLEWLNKYGAERLILAADVCHEMITMHGWQKASTRRVTDYIADYAEQGIKYVLCTDIRKDGMLAGVNIELYRKILQHTPGINLIGSGGVSSMKDLEELDAIGVEGVIIGKAIYENRITIKELEQLC